MQDFKIALVQHDSPVGRKADNLAATVAWTKKAKKAGAELVCFPELNLTGHAGHHGMVADAEPVPDGPCVATLCDLARELDIHISAGIAEDDRGIRYNTQFVVGPKGYVGKQRKVHLSGDEYFFFRGGTQLPVFDLPMVRMGIVICYDNQLPEMSRCMAVQGAELIFAPHAARHGKWLRKPEKRREVIANHKKNWKLIHAVRAIDNGCFVALCNTAGRSAHGIKGVEANHCGVCLVVAPGGRCIAESRSRDIRDEMVVAELEAKAVAHRPNMLQTRRPEVFGVLCQPTK